MLKLEDHLNLIYDIVWKYFKKAPFLEFEDLVSEACLACLEAQDRYNPKRGKPSTFITVVVKNRMKDLFHKAFKVAENETAATLSPELHAILAGAAPSPEHDLSLQESWMEKFVQLSPEAQYICHLALRPRRYMSVDTPTKYRRFLTNVLMKRGWKKAKIQRGFAEIKAVLSEKD